MKETIIFAICFVLLLGLSFYGGNTLARVSCENSAILMQKDYRYSFTTGCFIKVKNNWVPLNSSYRVVE
jgi:hypothetical protein